MYRYLVDFVLFFYYVCNYINTMVLIDNIFCFIWVMKYFTFKESRTITLHFNVLNTHKNISIDRGARGEVVKDERHMTCTIQFPNLLMCHPWVKVKPPLSRVKCSSITYVPTFTRFNPSTLRYFFFNFILYNDPLI